MTNKPIADLTPRVVSGLIDVIIILIAAVVLIWIWGFISGASGEHAYLSSQQIDDIWRGRGMLAYLIIDVIYTVGLQASSGGATFGQKSMGLRLVTVKYENPKLGALILRYFMSLISSIFLKIGYLIALFSDKKQTLHDMVSGTIVVREGSDLQKSMSPKSSVDSKPYAHTANTTSPSIKTPSPSASVNALTPAPENDEVYYERALDEFESNRRKGLWIKLMTQNEGDEVKSKFQYIKTRAQEIQVEDTEVEQQRESARYQALHVENQRNDAREIITCRKCSQKIRVENRAGMVECPSCSHSWLFEKKETDTNLISQNKNFNNAKTSILSWIGLFWGRFNPVGKIGIIGIIVLVVLAFIINDEDKNKVNKNASAVSISIERSSSWQYDVSELRRGIAGGNFIVSDMSAEIISNIFDIFDKPWNHYRDTLPANLVSVIEQKNIWWVEDNKFYIRLFNPSQFRIVGIAFSLASSSCSEKSNEKTFLNFDIADSPLPPNSYGVYSSNLPFNFSQKFGSGTKCGVIELAQIVK